MTTTRTHFTAWLTTDPKLGLSEFAEVDVLEDDLIGEDADDDANWTTKPGGNAPLSAPTTVHKDDHDDTAAQNSARDMLETAGWRLAGDWQQTDHGYIATVERDQ